MQRIVKVISDKGQEIGTVSGISLITVKPKIEKLLETYIKSSYWKDKEYYQPQLFSWEKVDRNHLNVSVSTFIETPKNRHQVYETYVYHFKCQVLMDVTKDQVKGFNEEV